MKNFKPLNHELTLTMSHMKKVKSDNYNINRLNIVNNFKLTRGKELQQIP